MGTKSNRSSGTQPNRRGIAQGNTLVDPKTGYPVCVKEDAAGDFRLCVDALTTINAQNIIVDVNLDSDTDAVRVEDPDTGAHVRVEADGSINANVAVEAEDGDSIAIGAHPFQIFDEDADTITTANYEQIYSYTSTDDNTRIVVVECTVSTPSSIQLKIDGNVKRIKRSSSLERNVVFEFKEHRPLPSGAVLTVEARVERLILTSYSTFTSLEGYRT